MWRGAFAKALAMTRAAEGIWFGRIEEMRGPVMRILPGPSQDDGRGHTPHPH